MTIHDQIDRVTMEYSAVRLPFHFIDTDTGTYHTVTFLKAGSKPGIRNWVPKIGHCKIFGCPNFKGDHNILRFQP